MKACVFCQIPLRYLAFFYKKNNHRVPPPLFSKKKTKKTQDCSWVNNYQCTISYLCDESAITTKTLG